jgi:hypothetical protein
MLAVADTALDFLVPQLVFHGLGVGVVGFILGLLPPVDRRRENDVLGYCRGVRVGSGRVIRAIPKLLPSPPLRHAGVDDFAPGNIAHTTCDLDFLALIIVPIFDDRPGTVLVLYLLDWRKVGGRLLELVVVRPIVPISQG